MLRLFKSSLAGAKALPKPIRVIFHPIVLLAIALHGFLLFFPFSSEQKPKPKKDEPQAVKITQLSKTSAPKPQPKRQLPRAKTSSSKTPVPAASPKPEAANGGQKDPFADFPHYSPSTPDCFGRGLGDNCRIANASVETLVSYFKKALPEKKYQFAIEESGASRTTIRIAKGKDQSYVTVLSDPPTTVYVLSPQPVRSLADLKGAVIVPSQLYELISSLVPNADPNDPSATFTAKRENFAQPDLFFKPSADPDAVPESLPNLDGTPGIVPGQTPEGLYATMQPQLKGFFETVEMAGNYAGGPLYRLKQRSTTVYLSIVPSQGSVSGAIVSVWLKDPR